MSVLPGPFSTAAFALAALLATAQAGAAPDQGAATPAARAAARAAVVAYNKQREEAQLELKADDVKRVQEVGRALLAAQADMTDPAVDEALRQEVKALHSDLESAIVAAELPRFSTSPEALEPVELRSMAAPGPDPKAQKKNSKASGPFRLIEPPRVDRPQSKADRRVAGRSSARDDGYGLVRKRLEGLQSKVDAAKTAGLSRADGSVANAGASRRTGSMVEKAQQLSEAVRSAIDAKPTPENKRRLVELRDRLRQKKLDELLSEREGTAAQPKPTLTSSIHLR